LQEMMRSMERHVADEDARRRRDEAALDLLRSQLEQCNIARESLSEQLHMVASEKLQLEMMIHEGHTSSDLWKVRNAVPSRAVSL